MSDVLRGTTIISVRNKKGVAIGGDGQITFGNAIFKNSARKIRKIYNNKVLAGLAGGVADALTLFELFEKKLDKRMGNMLNAAIDLAKYWRSDKILRKLEAMMVVVDKDISLIISGGGEVIEPEHGIAAIGSGSVFARSAAMAFLESGVDLHPKIIVEKSLKIAADTCIYTNTNIMTEELL